jgi:acetoin utilization protein AcuB
MTPKVVEVGPQDTLSHAVEAMRKHGIRHLPVCQGDQLIGVISERDTRRFQSVGIETSGKGLPPIISQMMNPDVVTIDPGGAVREAAALMVKHRIGALPVVEDGKVIGMISETDILNLVAGSDDY